MPVDAACLTVLLLVDRCTSVAAPGCDRSVPPPAWLAVGEPHCQRLRTRRPIDRRRGRSRSGIARPATPVSHRHRRCRSPPTCARRSGSHPLRRSASAAPRPSTASRSRPAARSRSPTRRQVRAQRHASSPPEPSCDVAAGRTTRIGVRARRSTCYPFDRARPADCERDDRRPRVMRIVVDSLAPRPAAGRPADACGGTDAMTAAHGRGGRPAERRRRGSSWPTRRSATSTPAPSCAAPAITALSTRRQWHGRAATSLGAGCEVTAAAVAFLYVNFVVNAGPPTGRAARARRSAPHAVTPDRHTVGLCALLLDAGHGRRTASTSSVAMTAAWTGSGAAPAQLCVAATSSCSAAISTPPACAERPAAAPTPVARPVASGCQYPCDGERRHAVLDAPLRPRRDPLDLAVWTPGGRCRRRSSRSGPTSVALREVALTLAGMPPLVVASEVDQLRDRLGRGGPGRGVPAAGRRLRRDVRRPARRPTSPARCGCCCRWRWC